jgi:hypothetical protein
MSVSYSGMANGGLSTLNGPGGRQRAGDQSSGGTLIKRALPSSFERTRRPAHAGHLAPGAVSAPAGAACGAGCAVAGEADS